MLHESSDDLEERLSKLRSQIDQLTASLPSPLAGAEPASASAPPRVSSDAERVEGKIEKFEVRLDQQLAELSEQVLAVVAEIRARATQRALTTSVDAASPLSPSTTPPSLSPSLSPSPSRSPSNARTAESLGALAAFKPERLPDDVRLLERDELFEGEIISVQPRPGRGRVRGVPPSQLLGGIVVLGVIVAGAIAGAVLLLPARRGPDGDLTKTAPAEGAAPAALQAARQQADAANQAAATRLADARAALQRAVDKIGSAAEPQRGGDSVDQTARAATPASAVANASSPSPSAVAKAPSSPPSAVASAASVASAPPRPAASTPPDSSPRNGDAIVPQAIAQLSLPPIDLPQAPVVGVVAVSAGGSLESSPIRVAGPVIGGIVPVAPFMSAGNQTLIVSGNGFQAGLRVTAFRPDNAGPTSMSSMQIQRVTLTSFEIVMPLAGRGTWGLRIDNPDGTQSSVFPFTVR